MSIYTESQFLVRPAGGAPELARKTSRPHPKLDVFELPSARRSGHGVVMGLVRAGSTCTDGLEGSPGRSDFHFRGGCRQQAARRALRFVRGRAGGYARAGERAREKNRGGRAHQTTQTKRGVGFGATLAKTSSSCMHEYLLKFPESFLTMIFFIRLVPTFQTVPLYVTSQRQHSTNASVTTRASLARSRWWHRAETSRWGIRILIFPDNRQAVLRDGASHPQIYFK